MTPLNRLLDPAFDLLLGTHALHHVEDLDLALHQIHSLVRPGGAAILVDSVDERRQVPRAWFRAEARKALLLDIRRHRRPLQEAAELYKLSTHPAWLAHLERDVFLTPEEYEQTYSRVFPGARFTQFYRTVGMTWEDQGWR